MSHRPFLFLSSFLSTSLALAQCDVRFMAAPPARFNDPPVMHERGGAAPYVIPVVVHMYYSDILFPVSTPRIMDVLEQANLDLRGVNTDVEDVCSAFTDRVGDLGIELRLATIDEDGNCMSGILYHWYDHTQGITPSYWDYSMNTGSYLNIHIFPTSNSWSVIPMPASPPLGSADDMVVLSYYDAQFRPRSLAHEVGHWSGLPHTFGASNTSGENCGDDGIADTPVTKGSVVETCDTTLSICSPGVIENVDNFMDYSNCGKMFTLDQASHVAAIMTDPEIFRANHYTPENLAATGVYLPSTCPLTADFRWRATPTCGSSTVEFRPFCMGQLPDQISWEFPGGSPSTSTEAEPFISYTVSGTYSAQFTACHEGECVTTTHMVDVIVLDASANGLPLYSPMPFTEDFEDGFSFPQTHMVPQTSSGGTWQVCDFAGYNSDHCLWIPGEAVAVADTNDLVLGNFDLTGLIQPTISFKIAVTHYDTCWGQLVDITFHDLCSNIFMGDIWAMHNSYDLAGNNHEPNFIPTSDDQWNTVTATFPVWNLATTAELAISVKRNWLPSPPFDPEPIFIDDITIGELDVHTGLPMIPASGDLLVYPNPASDQVTMIGEANAFLRVTDMAGRTVLQQRTTGERTELDVSAWARGSYVISLKALGRVKHAHLVVP